MPRPSAAAALPRIPWFCPFDPNSYPLIVITDNRLGLVEIYSLKK
jgi:hypothetical protein